MDQLKKRLAAITKNVEMRAERRSLIRICSLGVQSVAIIAWLALGQIPALAAGVQTHRVRVAPSLATQLAAQGGQLVADYGSFQVYQTAQLVGELATNSLVEPLDPRILLHGKELDTTAVEIQALRKAVGSFSGKRMHLIQFAGPVQPAWHEELLAAGVKIIAYIPNNAYLVYGDAPALTQLQSKASAGPHIQWEGAYEEEYRLHPNARLTDANGNPREIGTDLFAIQMVADNNANPATLEMIDQLKLEPIRRQETVMGLVDVVVRIAPADLTRLAAQADVISIQAYHPRFKVCERQDQIVAGNLSGNTPSGPGYLPWLATKGFTQAQFTASGFVVDVSDSGIDNGTSAPYHFGLHLGGILANSSRVVYNRLVGTPNIGSTLKGCDGHGNLNAHIIGGYDDLTGFPFADSSGYHYGLGVCPFVKVGSSVIFDPDYFTDPDYASLLSQAYRNGARISSNSWGTTNNNYDIDCQQYDALVRDAQPAGTIYATAGNQEMVIVFAAGNEGTAAHTVGSPGTAKNVITVGAAENVQAFGGSDGSGITDSDANNANDIAWFSSRGPCSDQRHKPDLVAPGTHVSGGVVQTATPSSTGTADSCFKGSGVSGGVGISFFPSGQQYYTASSGTSHSTPCVAGACALVRQYFLNRYTNAPSPAMTKAYLMNSTRYLTGAYANDTLWSENQGMGELNLGMAFDDIPRLVRDQVAADLLTASGQVRTFTGIVGDSSQPFRVTLAWTDAPGSTAGNACNNNLDLTVTVGGVTYKGNVFSGQYSVAGGTADTRNNVESVFLPAGTSGTFIVKVTAANINSDGVVNSGSTLDQDFALVVYNGTGGITAAGATLQSESFYPTNGVLDPGEAVTVDFGLQNGSPYDTTNLVATLQTSGGVAVAGEPQTYGRLATSGPVVKRSFTLMTTNACGTPVTATLLLKDGSQDLGSVSYILPVGKLVSAMVLTQDFDNVTVPALPSSWTTASSGGQSLWTTTTSASDTSPKSAFSAEASSAGINELITPVLTIVSSAAQLTFKNRYILEASSRTSTLGYDGGVLEIAIGTGAFTDILAAGGSFVTGGYNRTISSSYNNPLAGRQAWSGNSGSFITTTVTLPAAAAGQSIRLKWRCGTDSSTGGTGWYIDSISLVDGYYACSTSQAIPVLINPSETAGKLVFSFQSVSSQSYTVEYSDTFINPTWTPLQTLIGDGSILWYTNELSGTQGCYRVRSP